MSRSIRVGACSVGEGGLCPRSRYRLRSFSLLVLFLLAAAPLDDDLGAVADFTLTERSGRTVRNSDLLGKIWIASFEFTRCTSGCPQISETMKQLQSDFARYPDVRLVTFTVDPEHDRPEELREYARHYHADPERWLFLTGDEKTIYHLVEKSFHLLARQNEGKERTPGNEVAHDSRLVLVDRQGHIRGYFEGRPNSRSSNPERDQQIEMRKLKAKVTALEHDAWFGSFDFPRFHATLNAITAMLLLLGYSAIRRRLVRLHIACMLLALGLSALFLVSYAYYHTVIKHGMATSFASQTSHAHPPAWVGIVYQIVLWTHTPLAAIIALLAPITALLGLSRRWRWHVRLARWTLPIWLYVTITGVAVYWMLYRLYPLS